MPTKKLLTLIHNVNIAKDLDDDKLHEISDIVMRGLREDEESIRPWMKSCYNALELTQLERGPKNYPYRDASNIKYPLLSTACVQFSSRAFPEVLKNGNIAKFKVIGRDPELRKTRKGSRVMTYINYLMLEKIPNWVRDLDRLLQQLPVTGIVYKKTWYDPVGQTIRSEFVPFDMIVVNKDIKSLEEAPRISHYLSMSKRDIQQNVRMGLYRDVDLDALTKDTADSQAIYYKCVEQHCELDLDDDGMTEPYVVTVHHASGEILRIVTRYDETSLEYNASGEVSRILPQHYFSHIAFIENPDGSFLPLGFGTMMLDIAETVNTINNQLIDAGHLANTQGGIISKDLRIRKEDLALERGEWVVADSASGVELKENIVPFDYKEPSTVLFQLMTHLIEGAQQLTSTTDVLTGTADTTNASPNTVHALIQQSLKVNSAIVRRILTGVKTEVRRIVQLAAIFTDVNEYLRVVDPTLEEMQEMFDPETGRLLDFDFTEIDIVPMADGEMSTEAENLVRAQQEFTAGLQLAQLGAVDARALARSFFNAIQSPNVEQLVSPPPDPRIPDPRMIQLQSELDKTAKELELKDREQKRKELETVANIRETLTKSVKNVADAAATKEGVKVDMYKATMAGIGQGVNFEKKLQELANAEQEAELLAQQQAAMQQGQPPVV
jgi:chaperonin GroES